MNVSDQVLALITKEKELVREYERISADLIDVRTDLSNARCGLNLKEAVCFLPEEQRPEIVEVYQRTESPAMRLSLLRVKQAPSYAFLMVSDCPCLDAAPAYIRWRIPRSQQQDIDFAIATFHQLEQACSLGNVLQSNLLAFFTEHEKSPATLFVYRSDEETRSDWKLFTRQSDLPFGMQIAPAQEFSTQQYMGFMHSLAHIADCFSWAQFFFDGVPLDFYQWKDASHESCGQEDNK